MSSVIAARPQHPYFSTVVPQSRSVFGTSRRHTQPAAAPTEADEENKKLLEDLKLELRSRQLEELDQAAQRSVAAEVESALESRLGDGACLVDEAGRSRMRVPRSSAPLSYWDAPFLTVSFRDSNSFLWARRASLSCVDRSL